jgi:hypothetical protein
MTRVAPGLRHPLARTAHHAVRHRRPRPAGDGTTGTIRTTSTTARTGNQEGLT